CRGHAREPRGRSGLLPAARQCQGDDNRDARLHRSGRRHRRPRRGTAGASPPVDGGDFRQPGIAFPGRTHGSGCLQVMNLPYAHGGPPLRGRMRVIADDFEVDEVLGFEPDGQGEHSYLRIEKRDANTEWVAQQLAAFAGVAPMAVSYSGLKDRHALTRQTLSVQLPGRPEPDWDALRVEGVKVLSAVRHSRKLKRGTHKSNLFRIRLRELQGSRDEAEARIGQLGRLGVPNYFGEQRFGRNNENLHAARALFGGRRMSRSQRGFALSAARSWLFNAVLGRRV